MKTFDGLANTSSNFGQLLGAEEERGDAGDNYELRHSEAEKAIARQPSLLGASQREAEAGPAADVVAEEN